MRDAGVPSANNMCMSLCKDRAERLQSQEIRPTKVSRINEFSLTEQQKKSEKNGHSPIGAAGRVKLSWKAASAAEPAQKPR